MTPASFDESNVVLDKPQDMSYDECDALSVLRTETTEGLPVVISCWKPTKEELDEIIKTGRVWLTIYGYTMPPAYVSGTKPWS
jgi:hypothetical protein